MIKEESILQAIEQFILEKGWLKSVQSIQFLAAGEYNENYRLIAGRKNYVFRINHGSQLGLERQIEYEFEALRLLEESGVTPKAFSYDAGPNPFGGGVMLEEFIPGRPLLYSRDLSRAAAIFAKVHSIRGSGSLIVQEDPVKDIVKESLGMLNRHPVIEFADVYRRLDDYSKELSGDDYRPEKLFQGEDLCPVNTEVNSGNFIMGESRNSLVDWEKAVYSYRYLDLAHFTVKTTTLWKTDAVLSDEEKKLFLKEYQSLLPGPLDWEALRERTIRMERVIVLRALSWCFMAHYEYVHLPRPIKNEATFQKIKQYLSEAEWFLK